MKKSPTNDYKHECLDCNYYTNNKKDYNKHCTTRKHKKSQNKEIYEEFVDFKCITCNKIYKHRSGLSRHKKKCMTYDIITVENGNNDNLLPLNDNKKSSMNKNLLVDIFKEQQKQMSETISLLKESMKANANMIPKIGNNNNNTISINVFLNQECKNAMNLTDFIDKLYVSLDDLDYSKNNGFIAGVTNIFTKQLKDMDPKDRPIHCSDSKRLQFYVKDDDKWAKDANNIQIDKTISNIKLKQTCKLSDWEDLHPNYQNSPEQLYEWQLMFASMTEDVTSDNPDKLKTALKRNIADHTQLKEAMIKKN
jgi:hypothetical protein